MVVTPSLYFGTRRCTYSTVVSVVTTALILPRLTENATPKAVWAHSFDANMETTTSSPVKSSNKLLNASLDPGITAASYCFDSPYASFAPGELASTHAVGLAQEREFFMRHLNDARRERFQLEQKAAFTIQGLYKGYVLRRKFRDMRAKLTMRKRIRSNLVRVTRGTAIVLGEKDRRARISAQRNQAVVLIQGTYRCWAARRWLVAERHRRQYERKLSSLITVQAAWRAALARAFVSKIRARYWQEARRTLASIALRLYYGYLARQRVRKILFQRQIAAVRRLQSFVRRKLLACKTLVQQRQRIMLERRHNAAILIQKHIRGASGRARVTRMRLDEIRLVQAACSLSIQRVVRGFLGRQYARYIRVFSIHCRAWICASHVTRIVRGFLGRRYATVETWVQQSDVLVQARKGNLDGVVDLLDGYRPDGTVMENEEGEIQAADITVLTERGNNSVLHLAAKFGHMEIVTLVLPKMRELSPNMIYMRNRKGYSALSLAILHGHEQVAMYILAMTAPDLFIVAESAHMTCSASKRQRTLLHDAARQGLKLVVEKLLLLFPTLCTGIERDAWTLRTALHEALFFDAEATSREETIAGVLSCLLSRIAVSKFLDSQDFVGFTALHTAAANGNLSATRLLLNNEADVAVMDSNERTAWRVALLQGHEACFVEIRRKWLGSDSGDPEDSRSSSSALIAAAARSRRTVSLHPQLLQEAFASVTNGDVERLRFLIEECGVEADSKKIIGDDKSPSLLLRACEVGGINSVKLLLAHCELATDVGAATAGLRQAITDDHRELADVLVLRGAADTLLVATPDDESTLIQEADTRGFDTRAWLRIPLE